jgi:hypothetical protein
MKMLLASALVLLLGGAATGRAEEGPPAEVESMLALAVARAREGDLMGFSDMSLAGSKPLADQLAGLLGDPDPNVRLGACRALGFAARQDLVSRLKPALADMDWRVCHAACLSAIQLTARPAGSETPAPNAKEILPALEELSKNHWYPRVRNTARYAMERLQRVESPNELLLRDIGGYPRNGEAPEFQFKPFDFGSVRRTPLEAERVEKLSVTSGKPDRVVFWDIPPGSSREESKLVTFRNREPALYSAIREENKRGGSREWSYYCRLTGLVKRGETTFVALSAGEWVGGLFAVRNGEATMLLERNINGLIEWGDRLVAFAGTEHMGIDHGAVYEIARMGAGWAMKYTYALPGCPDSTAGILPDGRLFANCGGGAVAIGKDGHFEYLGSGGNEPGE